MLKAHAEAAAEAKDVAAKAIGKNGLFYITLIVIIGVAASIYLDENKIAAVIGLLSAALTALISMLSGISEAEKQRENPEIEILRRLIDMMDRENIVVDVTSDRVKIQKGNNTVNTQRPTAETQPEAE